MHGFKRTLATLALSTLSLSAFAQSRMPLRSNYDGKSPWTGAYIGVNAGGDFGDSTITTTGQAAANVNNVNGGARPANAYVGRSGILGGAQFGLGAQLHHFYLGAETDFDGANLKGTQTFTTTALTGGGILTNTFNSNLNYLGTARARVGLVFGRTLLYGTGGFAYGQTDQSASFTGAAPANTVQFVGSRSAIEKGYAAGGGAEYRLNKHFSMGAEYMRFKLEDETLAVNVIAGSGGGGTGYNSSFQNQGDTLRLRANYRF